MGSYVDSNPLLLLKSADMYDIIHTSFCGIVDSNL